MAVAREVVWHEEIAVPGKWIEFVDGNVLRKLPQDTKVEGISPHGASYWTRTAEVKTKQANGTAVSFFLKVTQGEVGKSMVCGEFFSMRALHTVLPDTVAVPIGWGTYASDSNIHFFLCSFVDMTDDLPEVEAFTSKIAELHRKSYSPFNMYGFAVPTLQGTIPQYTEWTDSWEDFFLEYFKRVVEAEEKAQGHDPEVAELVEAIITKVIPRLLRPLETGGRQIRPCLVHGDLWDGNTSTNIESDMPVIFDATCIYAHNELELAPMRPARHRMTKPYVKAYFRHFPVSAPEEDQDDRNALYCLRWDLNCSALYIGNLRWRKIATEAMRNLVDKHGGGYEAWAIARGEKVVTKSTKPRTGIKADVSRHGDNIVLEETTSLLEEKLQLPGKSS